MALDKSPVKIHYDHKIGNSKIIPEVESEGHSQGHYQGLNQGLRQGQSQVGITGKVRVSEWGTERSQGPRADSGRSQGQCQGRSQTVQASILHI